MRKIESIGVKSFEYEEVLIVLVVEGFSSSKKIPNLSFGKE